jgi:hypothetical protein
VRQVAVVAIKSVHTVIFFALGGSLAYFFWSGVRGRSDRRAAIVYP